MKNKIEIIRKEIQELKAKHKTLLQIEYIELNKKQYDELKNKDIDGIPVQLSLETKDNRELTDNSCKIVGKGVIKYFSLSGYKI